MPDHNIIRYAPADPGIVLGAFVSQNTSIGPVLTFYLALVDEKTGTEVQVLLNPATSHMEHLREQLNDATAELREIAQHSRAQEDQ